MELYRSIALTIEQSGKTQADWAEACGIDPSNLSKYLRGKRGVSGSVIQKLLYAMTSHQRIITLNRVGWNGGCPPEDLERIQEFKEEIAEIERMMARGEGKE